MSVASRERLRRDLLDLLHGASDVHTLSSDAARVLRRSVAFDGMCMLTLDPATLLPTGETTENALPPQTRARMAQIEIGGDDVNAFRELLHSEHGVARLVEATDGDPDRSLRHRELRAPNVFGDELRSVLASGGTPWGGLTLLRGADHEPFTDRDAALVEAVSPQIAEGLRRAILLTALGAPGDEDEHGAGLLLLADDDSVAMMDAAAERWLARLGSPEPGDHLPPVVAAVASRVRSTPDEQAPLLARARVCAPPGVWLVIRASRLSGADGPRTAVTIEPARAHDLAPLIADAYGLTDRERAVTRLVAQGHPTASIAARLHISPWTVQDHLKSIFEKVGVGTRGELVARVFFEHYAPRLAEDAPLDQSGWFGPDRA